MSGWNAYIDNLMASAKPITKAAILGSTDGSIWARSEGDKQFGASAEECKKFAALFAKIDTVPQTGFDLEGVHYICPRVEESLIFGKKDKCGVFALKTNMSVVLAIYEGDRSEGQDARQAVEKMGEYLSSSGY